MSDSGIRWAPVPVRKLTLCRVTVNMVGAQAGEIVNVDLTLDGMGTLVEGGYLVPQPEPPAPPLMADVLVSEQPPDASEAAQDGSGADEPLDAAPSTSEP